MKRAHKPRVRTSGSDDPVVPDRQDILRMSLGFRPADPLESMVKLKMAQYADTLTWLKEKQAGREADP
jgi:hypothetical protein